jgi:outer membrane protein OmpA-like peptidoglycan-associated protein
MIGRPHAAPAMLALLVATACGPKPAPQAAGRQHEDLVVLLPDPESKSVGRVVVSSPGGDSVELTGERQSTRVVEGRPPVPPSTMEEAEVQQVFGAALQARPPAPRHFMLYFESGTDELTTESQQQLSEILEFVKSRVAPDVSVIGHTDTTAGAQSNVALGLRRATMIRDRLVRDGLDSALVSVASHGESNLLVPTPDNTPAALNRRVEVSVR